MISHDISMIYPPTPAFAKAGAAPGSTGGVELGSRVASKGTRHQGNTSVSYMPQPSTCSCRTLTPTCPCHLFFRTFKTAVCPASNPPNASAGLQGNNSYSYYMPLPSVFQGVQDCRLPALKPPKRFQPFRRPPRQQLLQPFARPQTPQTLPTLPQASKATTLTATCPCHLFFRGFKTAVCPPSNPPNGSNPSAGLQGNNSYSYMPLPSVFQGVQDCRLPALTPPKRCVALVQVQRACPQRIPTACIEGKNLSQAHEDARVALAAIQAYQKPETMSNANGKCGPILRCESCVQL